MKIGVLITAGPYQHQASDSAYRFVQAALAKGHEITGIFLFMDGVYNANNRINPPGERNFKEMWSEVAGQGVDMVACTACAKFRGLDKEIRVTTVRQSGIGQLYDFISQSDRFITFGA